jgi:hypothetical protein
VISLPLSEIGSSGGLWAVGGAAQLSRAEREEKKKKKRQNRK